MILQTTPPNNLVDLPIIPASFDAERFPILARHWPDLPEPTAQVRRAHLVGHLHQLDLHTLEPPIMEAR